MNLVSNVLDIPELFWSEASLKGLYDAVRDYMDIEPRVNVLNEKLAVVGDLVRTAHSLLMISDLTIVGCHSRRPQQLCDGKDYNYHYLVSTIRFRHCHSAHLYSG